MTVPVNTIKVVDALVTDVYRGDKGRDYITFSQPGNRQFKLGMPSDQVKNVEYGDMVSFEAVVAIKTGNDGMYMQVENVKLAKPAKNEQKS